MPAFLKFYIHLKGHKNSHNTEFKYNYNRLTWHLTFNNNALWPELQNFQALYSSVTVCAKYVLFAKILSV